MLPEVLVVGSLPQDMRHQGLETVRWRIFVTCSGVTYGMLFSPTVDLKFPNRLWQVNNPTCSVLRIACKLSRKGLSPQVETYLTISDIGNLPLIISNVYSLCQQNTVHCYLSLKLFSGYVELSYTTALMIVTVSFWTQCIMGLTY